MYSKYANYMSIARQLGYPKEVIERIRNAESEMECERILRSERTKKEKSNKPIYNHKGAIRFEFKRKG